MDKGKKSVEKKKTTKKDEKEEGPLAGQHIAATGEFEPYPKDKIH